MCEQITDEVKEKPKIVVRNKKSKGVTKYLRPAEPEIILEENEDKKQLEADAEDEVLDLQKLENSEIGNYQII